MNPSTREKLAILQAELAAKKQEVSEKQAKIARLKTEVEELQRRMAGGQDQPTESEDA